MKVSGFAVLALFAAGCAASTPQAVATTTMTSAEAPRIAPVAPPVAVASVETPTPVAAEPEPEPLPTSCAGEQAFKSTKACLMPGDFVKKMCAASYPDLTLALFAKGTPWTRAWLAGDVEAWSASGGFTSRAKLAFDEEVIVLARHAAPSVGGIVMSGGSANFDVLRWDGTCVSVAEGELTAKRPPKPKSSPMRWSRFEEATQEALLTAKKVKSSRDALNKACLGTKASCERAEKDFANAVATTVRSGATELPSPSRKP
jgi:hypothetical protein